MEVVQRILNLMPNYLLPQLNRTNLHFAPFPIVHSIQLIIPTNSTRSFFQSPDNRFLAFIQVSLSQQIRKVSFVLEALKMDHSN